MHIHTLFDQAVRQADKAESRRADADDLRLGHVSSADLARTNGFFSTLDMRGSRIVAIGARELAEVRRGRP